MKLLGISGSPVPNSNTDRAVMAVLESSTLDYDFIKLSDYNVRPCMACKSCVNDNICKVQDDFQFIAEKLKDADGVVLGGYVPYGMIDGFTKSFLERLWSMRHKKSMNEGKYIVSIFSGLMPGAVKLAQEMISIEMEMEKAILIKQINLQGNVPCLTCGYGDDCKNSVVPMILGENVKASPKHCIAIESTPDWSNLKEAGYLLQTYITNLK